MQLGPTVKPAGNADCQADRWKGLNGDVRLDAQLIIKPAPSSIRSDMTQGRRVRTSVNVRRAWGRHTRRLRPVESCWWWWPPASPAWPELDWDIGYCLHRCLCLSAQFPSLVAEADQAGKSGTTRGRLDTADISPLASVSVIMGEGAAKEADTGEDIVTRLGGGTCWGPLTCCDRRLYKPRPPSSLPLSLLPTTC